MLRSSIPRLLQVEALKLVFCVTPTSGRTWQCHDVGTAVDKEVHLESKTSLAGDFEPNLGHSSSHGILIKYTCNLNLSWAEFMTDQGPVCVERNFASMPLVRKNEEWTSSRLAMLGMLSDTFVAWEESFSFIPAQIHGNSTETTYWNNTNVYITCRALEASIFFYPSGSGLQ